MNDKTRKELKDMLKAVSKEKELAGILYERLWSKVIYSYYCAIAYDHNTEFGIRCNTDIEEQIKEISKDASVSSAMIHNILFSMVEKDGFEIEYGDKFTTFIISVEQINNLIQPEEEKKHAKSKNSIK